MNTNNIANYIGRFAPSPTGRLHLGSLVCAVASFLDAKANQGLWLVRMEDIDPLREEPGASHHIIKCLAAHGMISDEPILWQHDRLGAYQTAIDNLVAEQKAFYCICTRKQLAAEGGPYPGYCKSKKIGAEFNTAIRAAVEPATLLQFVDAIQGPQSQSLDKEIGDFIIKRKDGLIAYQLAVAIDDAYQNISHVVRGSDLLDSTLRQIHLQKLLQLPTPHYAHIPVITHSDGHKLSKQTHASEVKTSEARHNLRLALRLLGQQPPPQHLTVTQLIDWGTEHWALNNISRSFSIAEQR
jgi:glutamyl-Q tRNA(Asp) synthetase